MKLETKTTKKVYSNYKKHHHDTLALSLIKKGKLKILFDTKELFLVPNQLVVFNPFENHKTMVLDKETADYHVIYFDLQWCEDIQGIDIFNPIASSIIDNREFVDRFLSLHASKDTSDAKLFLTDLFKRYCDESTIKKEKRSDFLDQVLAYIDVSDELSLEDLSRHFSISKNHLIRLFKNEFGLSVHAYIVNKKVHHAKRLLTEGKSIAEVSVEAGFYDQSHFHKTFKSVFGMTPKEFQKR